jgi:hypothetical protein
VVRGGEGGVGEWGVGGFEKGGFEGIRRGLRGLEGWRRVVGTERRRGD